MTNSWLHRGQTTMPQLLNILGQWAQATLSAGSKRLPHKGH
ncbi:MAG TPA: hypothetical protein VMM82_07880 [Spirochaetia bacterium]|nr:hypothetical protein [Spirochaetia bacterium]